jgi:hypothetical protein
LVKPFVSRAALAALPAPVLLEGTRFAAPEHSSEQMQDPDPYLDFRPPIRNAGNEADHGASLPPPNDEARALGEQRFRAFMDGLARKLAKSAGNDNPTADEVKSANG